MPLKRLSMQLGELLADEAFEYKYGFSRFYRDNNSGTNLQDTAATFSTARSMGKEVKGKTQTYYQVNKFHIVSFGCGYEKEK